MRIEDWSIQPTLVNEYYPPEAQHRVVCGIVYDNPNHKDGTLIRTSRIQSIDGNKVTTLNSVYELGRPSKEYVQWCKDNNVNYKTI